MRASDAIQLIQAAKIAVHWTDFQRRNNHAGHVIGAAQFMDEAGVYLPGLTLEIEIKAPIVSAQCLFQFSIRQKTGRLKEVVYQLEVTPAGKRSHNGLTTIYGPHEHIGDDEPIPVQNSDVNCENWGGCLAWFLKRINTTGLHLEKPC